MHDRLSKSDLVEAWIASLEGQHLYVDSDPDTPMHIRKDCPRLGLPVTVLTVQGGLLVDEHGFYYRHWIPCDMCVREICRDSELEDKS
jgi:hypothetical protein